MKYKGDYASGTSYSVDDVVVYTDGIPYRLQNPAPAGTTPHDTGAWNRLLGPMASAVVMFHDMFAGLLTSAASAADTKTVVDAMLFDAKTIVLASSTASSEKSFAITVDDDGDLSATEITDEEEAAEGGES